MKVENKSKILTGKKGEKIAIEYLKKNGYHIKEINFRCPLGELDIVAREKKTIVFVEVKTRYSIKSGYPEQSVNFRKQRKLSQLAQWYMQKNKITEQSARFDVVAVTLDKQCVDIKLIKNAFDFID
ncbi:MAG TPA: YraN family protein [Smithellaceae bacterium]|nr:MAG: hypothetical protein BWY90_00802 [Deltaproteobacteria bacterium ADurb.BinA014]HNQ17914.1 YraN family protein [Smithellaceae bacterium]HNZ30542.1 YraN family protein [Smithellaceae bacterium]HPY34411.1 YraN family protein [Smithellaceae bacterium]HQB91814.1 YraN family protein [Smithellaceae bacterium]